MTDKEKKDLRVELKARKIVQKKLNTATVALYKKILKIRAEREKRIAELSEYHDERDLQDAYGWGIITEDEYDRRLAALRDGRDKIDAEVSAEEIAWDILSGWSRITKGDIASLEFELLPPAKQEEIRQRNYEIAQEREKRRKERDN